MTSLVLAILGDDRPGLVEAVSAAVTQHGGNWDQSRMAHLAGKFAGVLRVEVPEAEADALTAAMRELQSRGLTVIVEQTVEPPAAEPGAEGATLDLELVGHDRPGIVRDLSHALARRGVNVEELRTERTSAPMSGEPLFRATARLRAPAGVSLPELRGDLEPLAAALMVDIRLSPAGLTG